MWWGPGSDPGGSSEGPSKDPSQNQQLQDLQEQFDQQQTLIAQLKEMLRKTEQSSSVNREKVEEYANTLTKLNARAKRSKFKKSDVKGETKTEITGESKKLEVVTPAKEKINLLRQQLEENRAKLAQRDKNQRGIEEVVNQLKAQLDESQLINESSVNISLPDIQYIPTYTVETSKEELLTIINLKDKSIEDLTMRLQQMEANVLDLQENVKEKDSVIDARTKAITLLSENLSKKGKNTLDMLDETKEQMRSMQENFVLLETNMKEENNTLQFNLKMKDSKIEKLIKDSEVLQKEYDSIFNINNDLQNTIENLNIEMVKYRSELSEHEMKMEDLNKLNSELLDKIKELESIGLESLEDKLDQKSTKKRTGRKSKSKERTDIQIHLTRISELEKTIQELKGKKNSETEDDELTKLKKQLDDMNKNMIKMKAQHKAKLKEVQKKSNKDDADDRIVNLESENSKLNQRIIELEEEKGNLQLGLIEVDSNKDKEHIEDLENRIEEQRMEIENHIRTITSLETQISSTSNEISSLKNQLANFVHLENAQVCSEMTSVQLEEQLDKEVLQNKELHEKFNLVIKEKEDLTEKIDVLNKEKQDLLSKLENYMQENIELIDRLEKLSAEKVSSAESIEIVESLTQQEKLEIEAYQKNLEQFEKGESEVSELEQNPDLNESVTKLTEDTSELMEKIELFTAERREVMDKMDSLNVENKQLLEKLETCEREKQVLKENYEILSHEKENLSIKLDEVVKQNHDLLQKIEDHSKPETLTSKSTEFKMEFENLEEHIVNQKLQIIKLEKELIQKELLEKKKINAENNLLQITSENDNMHTSIIQLTNQKQMLENSYEALIKENQELATQLKQSLEITQKTDVIEKQYSDAKFQVSKLEKELAENLKEIESLQSTINNNKIDLIKSSELTAILQTELDAKNNEISSYQNEIKLLHDEINKISVEIEEKNRINDNNDQTVELLTLQLVEVKTMMSENLNDVQKYESEIERNTKIIENLNDQLNNLNYKVVETEHIIEMKTMDINNLNAEKNGLENKLLNLQQEIQEKNFRFAEMCEQLQTKCLHLENQIKANSGSLENMREPFEVKIKELESKNKELVEKMKKIAANLKKKSVYCQELEAKLKDTSEKWENVEQQNNSLLNQMHDVESKFLILQTVFKDKDLECDNFKLNIENQCQKIQELITENNESREKIHEYSTLNNALQTMKINYEDEIEQLHDRLKSQSGNDTENLIQQLNEQLQQMDNNYTITKNAFDAKLKENCMLIETLESENMAYKNKMIKLEENMITCEKRKENLENRMLELGSQLKEKDFAYEEASQVEDILEQRLVALIAHNETLEKKLQETITENENLQENLNEANEMHREIQTKLFDNEQKFKEVQNEKLLLLENENLHLSESINNREHQIKKLQMEFDKKLEEKNFEIENIEVELNAQLQESNIERKNLLARCEMLEDNLKEFSNNERLELCEVEQLKQKLSCIKTDLDTVQLENDNLKVENANQLVQINELKICATDAKYEVSNDDAGKGLQSKIESLHKLITQKDIDIQNYQKQNMQLQMSANFNQTGVSHVSSSFDFILNETEELRSILAVKNIECNELKSQVNESRAQLTVALNDVQVANLKITELNKNIELLCEQQTNLSLNKKMATQQEPSFESTAANEVENVITKAEISVLEERVVSPEPQLEEQIIENQQVYLASVPLPPRVFEDIKQEDLLNKIKTLEFMLFNVEKEKNDAISQCHELSVELTRLIYERQKFIEDKIKLKPTRTEVDLKSIEAEILENECLSDSQEAKKTMNELEFSATYPYVADTGPVNEEIIEAKSAYVCYLDDKNTASTSKSVSDNIFAAERRKENDLITEMIDIKITLEEKKLFQAVEYEHVTIPNQPDCSEPCDEPINKPKSSYICFPEDGPDVVLQDTFASEEDGWGWSAEEARLEEEHRQHLNALLPQQNLQTKIDQLEANIKELHKENTRLLEEMKISQTRSNKLIKKLKDMKLKNDTLVLELNKKSAGGFDDLDRAIQDELKIQIQTLEQKNKELKEEYSKEKSERENLLKRLDVLTAGNERMLEMKEKQDNEIQMWQFRNRELSAKLEQLEWGDDSFGEIHSLSPQQNSSSFSEFDKDSSQLKKENEVLDKKVKELVDTVNDLTLDNEEMQSLLEEQRNMRLIAEKSLSIVSTQENVSEDVIKKLENKNVALQNDIIKYSKEIKDLENKAEQYLKDINSQQEQLQNFNVDNEAMINTLKNEHMSKVAALEQELYNSTAKLEILMQQIEELNVQNKNVNLEKDDIVTNQLGVIQHEKEELNRNVQEYRQKMQDLQKQNEKLIIENKNLATLNENLNMERVKVFESEINQLKEEVFNTEKIKMDLGNQLKEKNKSIELLNFTIEQLNIEKNDLQIRIEEMANITNNSELQQLNERITHLTSELECKARQLNTLEWTLSSERIAFEQKLVILTEEFSQEWSQRVDQRGNDVAESWKLHLESRENEFMNIEKKMKMELNEIYDKNEALLLENKELQSKVDLYIAEKQTNTSDQIISDLQVSFDEKQKEILQLSQQLHDVSLQLEAKNKEILSLKQSIDAVQSKDLEIAKMKSHLIEVEEHYEELLSTKDLDIENLRIQILEQSDRLTLEMNEKQNLQLQYDTLSRTDSEQLTDLKLYVEKQNIRIEELNQLLEKSSISNQTLSDELQCVKKTIETLNQTILEKTAAHDAVLLEFSATNCKITEMGQQLTEKTSSYDMLASNFHIFEETITDLNHQLALKSSDYDTLVVELENLRYSHRRELSTPVHEKRVTFRDPLESNTEPTHEPYQSQIVPTPVRKEPVDPENLPNPVNPAELDIALYMLHQRDVRCEELTLELMQLLEERDTLQLRLSNAIRVNEELKSKISPQNISDQEDKEKLNSPKKNAGAIPKSKSSAIVLGATGTELAMEATEQLITDVSISDKEKLASKLSELRSTGYRDKTLQEDQEHRHLQQLSLMQQHIDLASRLPPEAAARLVDANYTLSRDVQSPSKVLLNWLWGRSTPKVNDV